MAIALSIFGYMLAVVYVNSTWALGFLLGSAWSVANLYLIKGLVELVITPHTRSLRRIALYAVLIPYFGTYGAAAASSLAYAFMSGIALVSYRRMIAPARGRLFALGLDDLRWAATQLRMAWTRKKSPTEPVA